MAFNRVVAALVACVGTVAILNAQGTTRHKHAGVVTKSVSPQSPPQPLADAIASAYTNRPDDSKSCPSATKPLDQQKTKAQGEFEFQIDTNVTSYYAVYCRTGFQPDHEAVNDNTAGGTRIRPLPIILFPNLIPGMDETTEAFNAIANVIDTATTFLGKLRDSATSAFDQTVSGLRADADTVQRLRARKPLGPGFPISAEPGSVGLNIILLLNDATRHMIYFDNSAPAGFPSATKKFSTDDQLIIVRLRTRELVRVVNRAPAQPTAQ